MSADGQTLRVLEGRFVLEQVSDPDRDAEVGDVLALVFGPDGRTRVRRDSGHRVAD